MRMTHQDVPSTAPVLAALEAVRASDGPYSTRYLQDLIRSFYVGDAAGGQEAKELQFLRSLLADCDRFVDVGANVGQHTYNASLAMTGGELLCIEANPFLIPVLQVLRSHVESAGGRSNRVVVENVAVTDREEPVTFFVSAFAPGSSMLQRGGGAAATKVTVPGVPLDAFYKDARKTVIKVDVEGDEYRVISSAGRFLQSPNVLFFMELHGWGDEAIGKYPLHVCAFFRRRGFAGRHVGRRASNHYLFYPAGALERTARYLALLPRMSLMAAVYRYAKPAVPALRRLRRLVMG